MADDSFWESDDIMTEEEASQAMAEAEKEQSETANAEYGEYVENSQETTEEQAEGEDEDDAESDFQVLKDASLRLEQGNLYKMLLKHDLFEGVDADPRAITNVQKELRAFIRERLEILVGLKADPKITPKQTQSQFPFTDLEVQLLKEFLAKVTGNTQQPKPATLKTSSPQSGPAKIKPVLGGSSNVRVSPPKKAQPQPQPSRPKNPDKNEPRLTKPPSEMTAAELIEYNKKVIATRQQGKKAAASKKLPMPDSQQLENMYATRLQTNGGGNLINAILSKMGKGAPSLMETVDGGAYDDSNDGRM